MSEKLLEEYPAKRFGSLYEVNLQDKFDESMYTEIQRQL
jgi:hypothetical protein